MMWLHECPQHVSRGCGGTQEPERELQTAPAACSNITGLLAKMPRLHVPDMKGEQKLRQQQRQSCQWLLQHRQMAFPGQHACPDRRDRHVAWCCL